MDSPACAATGLAPPAQRQQGAMNNAWGALKEFGYTVPEDEEVLKKMGLSSAAAPVSANHIQSILAYYLRDPVDVGQPQLSDAFYMHLRFGWVPGTPARWSAVHFADVGVYVADAATRRVYKITDQTRGDKARLEKLTDLLLCRSGQLFRFDAEKGDWDGGDENFLEGV